MPNLQAVRQSDGPRGSVALRAMPSPDRQTQNRRLAWIAAAALAWWALTFSWAGAQCDSHGCRTGGGMRMGDGRMMQGNCEGGSCHMAGGRGRPELPDELGFASASPARPDINRLRKYIPDPELAANPRLMLYDDTTMPRVYQMPDDHPGHQGFHFAAYNISANGSEPFGNANYEFPWGHPGGTHRVPRGTSATFKGILLPEGKRIVWYRQKDDPSRAPVGWIYPQGTLVIEVMLMKCQDGQWRTYEMRTRERLERSWAVDVKRPCPTALHLSGAIKYLRPDAEQLAGVSGLVHHVSKPIAAPLRTLADQHPRQAFNVEAQVDVLPTGDAKLQAEILDTFEFESALGETWNGDKCFAASGFITPDNFDGSFLGTTENSCNRCHRDVGKHVDNFQPGRDWYGYVRGSDGIFSASWVDMSTVSGNGYPLATHMIDAPDILERFDPTRHTDYHQLAEDSSDVRPFTPGTKTY